MGPFNEKLSRFLFPFLNPFDCNFSLLSTDISSLSSFSLLSSSGKYSEQYNDQKIAMMSTCILCIFRDAEENETAVKGGPGVHLSFSNLVAILSVVLTMHKVVSMKFHGNTRHH